MISALLVDLLPWAIGIVAAAVGLWGYGRGKKQEGRTGAENDALRDTHERMEKGREAANDLRGAGRDAHLEQLRRNDDEW